MDWHSLEFTAAARSISRYRSSRCCCSHHHCLFLPIRCQEYFLVLDSLIVFSYEFPFVCHTVDELSPYPIDNSQSCSLVSKAEVSLFNFLEFRLNLVSFLLQFGHLFIGSRCFPGLVLVDCSDLYQPQFPKFHIFIY